jgi:SNF2 family DNA or RNA helicase
MELLEESVENGQKVVVFTGRREDCDKLTAEVTKKFGSDAAIFSGHGGTPAAVRDGIQQAYMASKGATILIGTGDAWGEGVNLQDSDLLLIAMLPYTPGQIVQWEGRVARHGQNRPVLIQYLVAEGTVDEHVAGILLDKLPAVENVAGDDSVTGLADQLRGADDADAIIDSIFAKMGVT